MGKVIVSVQMSADASIGPSIGWFGGDEEGTAEDEIHLADAMLLGRKTYEGLSRVWPKTPGDFATEVNAMPKHVASTTLSGPLEWNSQLITGDLAEEVRRLKEKYAGHLLTYGCGEFAYQLTKLGLVDEIHFWVHPVVWAEPQRPFHGLGHIRMERRATSVFRSGIIRNAYVPISVEDAPAED